MIDREDFIKSMSFDALLEMFKGTKDPERISAMYYVWRHFEMSYEGLYGLESVKREIIHRETNFGIPICKKAVEAAGSYGIRINTYRCPRHLSTTYMTLCSIAEYLMKEHIIYLSPLDNCDLSKTSQRALVFVAHHFKDFYENKRWSNLADAHNVWAKTDTDIWDIWCTDDELYQDLTNIGVYRQLGADEWRTASAKIQRVFDELNRRVK